MGQHTTHLEIDALRVLANRFDASAEMLDVAVGARLGRLAFDGASAGRCYTANGDALRRALDRLTSQVAQWARASNEIAVALRVSADHYAAAELRSTARIG